VRWRSALDEAQVEWREQEARWSAALEEAEGGRRREEVDRKKLELQVELSRVEVERLKEILARQEDRLQDQENRAR
jgi:hypothetical protein